MLGLSSLPLCNALVFSMECEDGSSSDEACSQVFVNQLSALPCQNSTSLSSPLFLSNRCKHHSRHRVHSNFCHIFDLNANQLLAVLSVFVVSGSKAVKVTNKSWQRSLFSLSMLISLETSTLQRPFKYS